MPFGLCVCVCVCVGWGWGCDFCTRYNDLATVPRALELFELFDVKHIQLDTLTQLILPELCGHGFVDSANEWSQRTCEYHERADREMASCVRASCVCLPCLLYTSPSPRDRG